LENIMTRLGWYCRAKRRARGLTAEALAVQLGYRNVRKGVRRILRLENCGQFRDNMLVNLTDALGVSYATILDLVERDAALYRR
jgi:transcriptional regulator with XRE-family HTH domain